jgi:hypothetical protein
MAARVDAEEFELDVNLPLMQHQSLNDTAKDQELVPSWKFRFLGSDVEIDKPELYVVSGTTWMVMSSDWLSFAAIPGGT